MARGNREQASRSAHLGCVPHSLRNDQQASRIERNLPHAIKKVQQKRRTAFKHEQEFVTHWMHFPIRPVGIHGQYSQQSPVLAAHEPANTGITWVPRHQLTPKVHASRKNNGRAVSLQQEVVSQKIERIFCHGESSRWV